MASITTMPSPVHKGAGLLSRLARCLLFHRELNARAHRYRSVFLCCAELFSRHAYFALTARARGLLQRARGIPAVVAEQPVKRVSVLTLDRNHKKKQK